MAAYPKCRERKIGRAYCGHLLVSILCGTAFCSQAQAQDEGRIIQSGIPDEFRDLVASDDAGDNKAPSVAFSTPGAFFAEFYADSFRHGDTIVFLDKGRLRFDDAEQAVSLIADAHNRDDLIRLFDQGFAADDSRLCIVRPGNPCAPPKIGSFGIIFDPQVPRVDVFRSYKYISPPEPLRPSHPDAIGVIASLTGRVSGRSGQGDDSRNGSITFDIIGGLGASSVFSAGSITDNGRLSVRNGGAQHFFGRHRAAGGFFLADSSEHFSQINIVGAELHTTDLTRAMADFSRDTPVLLFLDSDSYVDVLRDGELLYSQQLPAGPARLPTRDFPTGSYDLEIRIRDNAGNTRSEDRFFSRSNEHGRINQWEYGLQAGVTRDIGINRFGLQESGLPYVSLRANRQIGRATQIGGRLGRVDDLTFVEGFAERKFGRIFLRGSGLVTSDGGYSLAASLSGSLEKFSLSGRARHSDINSKISAFRGQTASYTELSFNLSRDLPGLGGQINGFARYIVQSDSNSKVGLGATWTKNVPLMRGRTNGQFTLSYQSTERDHRVLGGLRFSWQGRRAAASARIRNQTVRDRASGNNKSSTTQDAQVTYRSVSRSDKRWSLSARANHQGEGNGRIGLSGQVETKQFFADGQADRSFGDDQALNYFGSLAATIAVSPQGIALTGKRNVIAGIMVQTEKLGEGGAIEMRMNKGSKQQLSRGLEFIPVAPFLPQDINFRPDRNSSIGYGNAATRVIPFPGNIVSIDPNLFNQIAVFGRLVDATGLPLPNHFVEFGSINSYKTDDGGYFVFDIALGVRSVSVRLGDQQLCKIDLPELPSGNAEKVFDVEDLVCLPTFGK